MQAFNLVQRNTVTGEQKVIGSYSGEDAEFYAKKDCIRFNQYLNDESKFDEYCFVEPIDFVGK